MLKKNTTKPSQVKQVLADAMDRTQRQPELALNHAVDLDRELGRIGWSEPITYALHGAATLQSNSDAAGEPWRTSTPGKFDCLYQAHRQFVASPGLALATAAFPQNQLHPSHQHIDSAVNSVGLVCHATGAAQV